MPHYYTEYVQWILASRVHRSMAMIHNGTSWSSDLNCQNFNKAEIAHLGLSYPTDVTFFSDCSPTFFYIYASAYFSRDRSVNKN